MVSPLLQFLIAWFFISLLVIFLLCWIILSLARLSPRRGWFWRRVYWVRWICSQAHEFVHPYHSSIQVQWLFNEPEIRAGIATEIQTLLAEEQAA